MPAIESCSLQNAYFQYITNTMWKPGPRNDDAPNNLIFVTEGALYIEALGVRYAVTPGECLFLPHGTPSVGYRPSAVPTARFIIAFHTAENAASPAKITVPNLRPVRDLFNQIVKYAYCADFPRAGLDAMLHALLYTLQYQHRAPSDNTDDSLADSIKEYVHTSITRNPTVNTVAAHFSLSPDHINRVFSRAEHVTLKNYINQLQIERIEEYLISPNVSIQAVAKKMNFPSLSALSKFYKYHTGRTPEEYRSGFVREIERK